MLPRLLAQLHGQRGIGLEIVVADGGSGDGTPDLARAAGVTAIRAPRGRAMQMNAGARATASEFLLFLHADSELGQPDLLAQALAALKHASAQAGHDRLAGHFPLRFAGGRREHADFYRYLEGKTRLNRPYTINGDQGLLLSRTFFEELGGYDESLPFLEDQRIAARIFERGRWIVLPGELLTSARRFETEGVRNRYTLMALIMGLYAGGAEDLLEQLPQIYPPHGASGELELRPFTEAIERHLRGLGWRARWRLLYRIGGFVRENAWQLAYHRDVRRADGELRCLLRYDRFLAPLLANPAASALGALLARGWFMRIS